MMKTVFFTLLISMGLNASAQADEARVKSDEGIDKKAGEWTAALNLQDAAKKERVAAVIAWHLKTIRDWHNEHPYTTVPAGINPATGNKLSELDRQVIANSAMPKSVHDSLMKTLRKELDSGQVVTVLDKYTVGKVDFTMRGYKAIVPDLTAEEEATILGYLVQAREQAIDYKNMNQVSAIFEIYKTKSEQYLNSRGRNWKQLYKTYVDSVKANKAKTEKSKGQ